VTRGYRSSDVKFDDIRLFLCDPRTQVRSSLRMALTEAGLRNANIDEGSDMEGVATAVADPNGPDIIICDVTDCAEEAAEVFAEIRHNELGTNPFICIIAVAWSPRQPLVNKIVDSGADLLVAAPISPALILDRIFSLVHGRKPFVVTSDYVGPDRRFGDERGDSDREEVELVDVPNSLRDKAIGQFDAERIREEIESARSNINDQKIERQAHHVFFLAELVAEAYAKGPDYLEPRRLFELEKTTNQLKMRAFSAGARELEELCMALRQVVRRMIDSGGDYKKRDLDLLAQLSLAVRATVRSSSPGDGNNSIAHNISQTVIGAA
jgi:response regulator RpfG family c-di-GMP phosphodiesterase